jgi:putative endonuclease
MNGSKFWVYVLEDENGRFYIGQTDDLGRRIADHNSSGRPGSKFTTKSRSWQLVWSEEHPSRASAMRRERQIKAMKSAHWIRQNLLTR